MSPKAIFDKKNILVIGGAGFVGSHLCDELIASNKVICLDNFLTGDEDNIAHLLQNPDFELIKHDIVNPLDLEKQPGLNEFRIEFQGLQEIYFLGSPTSPADYTKYPIETLLINSLGLKNVLDLAVKYKAQLVYASSPAVYGQVEIKKAVTEDYVGKVNQLDSRACFAEGQRFGEALVENYRQVHNLDTKIVRISNCYGPRMRLNDGRMIPEMIKAAVNNEPVIIYGDKDSTGAYFYISDLIKGLVKLMASNEVGPINLASDWKTSFTEIAQKIIQLTKSDSKIKYQKPTVNMAPQPIMSIAQAKENLGWFPIILIDEGLNETVDYLSAQKGVLEPGK